MPGRRSVSVEPEDLVVASPRRRSARIAVRTDSPAPVLKIELASGSSNIPVKRSRRSQSIQEKSLADIEKDVSSIDSISKSRGISPLTLSNDSQSVQTNVAARRTRRSVSTQDTKVSTDDSQKNYKLIPVKRSKRLLSKEQSVDPSEDENKPESETDDTSVENVARKRMTRSMSRSPTNIQKSAPPVVKVFINRLSSNEKKTEDSKPTVLDIITENENETDKIETNSETRPLETDLLNNNAKKDSEKSDNQTENINENIPEDLTNKSTMPTLSELSGNMKDSNTDPAVQTSELNLENEKIVSNIAITDNSKEEIHLKINSTENVDVAEKSVTENSQNMLNDNETESKIMKDNLGKNTVTSKFFSKIDDTLHEAKRVEVDINMTELSVTLQPKLNIENYNKESENKNKSEFVKENTGTIDNLDVAGNEEKDNTEINERVEDDKLDNTGETVDKLEITEDEETMDKLEINEDSEDNLSENINEKECKLKVSDIMIDKSYEENYEFNVKVVVDPIETFEDSVVGIKSKEHDKTKETVVQHKMAQKLQEEDITEKHSVEEQSNLNIKNQNEVNVSIREEILNQIPENNDTETIEIEIDQQHNTSHNMQEKETIKIQSNEKQTKTPDTEDIETVEVELQEQNIEQVEQEEDLEPKNVPHQSEKKDDIEIHSEKIIDKINNTFANEGSENIEIDLQNQHQSKKLQEKDAIEIQSENISNNINKNSKNEDTEIVEEADVGLQEPHNKLQNKETIEMQSDDEQTNVMKKQNETFDVNIVKELIESEDTHKEVKETLKISNINNDSEINNGEDNTADISTREAIKNQDILNVTSKSEDNVTNISIVSCGKSHTCVDNSEKEDNCESNISIVDSPESNMSSTPIKDKTIEKNSPTKNEHERNLNLSLVNDNGKSYSPIMSRTENISVHFENSTCSIVNSTDSVEIKEVTEKIDEKNESVKIMEQVIEESYTEVSETSLNLVERKNLNESNNTTPEKRNDSSKIGELQSIATVNPEEEFNKSNQSSQENDTTNDENLDATKNVSDTGNLNKSQSKSPIKTQAEEVTTKCEEKSRDQMLDDFIEDFQVDKKRKRQNIDESIVDTLVKQKKKRELRTEFNFLADSDEESEIEKPCKQNKKKNRKTIDSSEDEESDESNGNEFIDDMASEGSEDTPSIDSNEIIDEGESVGSTESEIDTDEDYEHGSFVVDDDVGNEELLSGSDEIECWTPKRKRIITIQSDSEEEFEKMSTEPFGGSSPSLISVNHISSVDSDMESVRARNEELSKMIEEKAKTIDIEDTENDDLIIVNISSMKSVSCTDLTKKTDTEEVPKTLIENEMKDESNVEQQVIEITNEINETTNEITKSSEMEQVVELQNIDDDAKVEKIDITEKMSKSFTKTQNESKQNNNKPDQHSIELEEEINKTVSATINELITKSSKTDKVDTLKNVDENLKKSSNRESTDLKSSVTKSTEKLEEKENIIESTENKEVTQEMPDQKNIVDKFAKENNIDEEDNSEYILKEQQKDAKYKAILEKYFKQFDMNISKKIRRQTVGMFSDEKDAYAKENKKTKRKRRQSLSSENNKSLSDENRDIFESYKKSKTLKKACESVKEHDKKEVIKTSTDSNVADMKEKENKCLLKKFKTKKRKETTDQNTESLMDIAEHKYVISPKLKRRHSLTSVEKTAGKYIQSPEQQTKSFADYTSVNETETVLKKSKIDDTESEACMLNDFNDKIKDVTESVKTYALSPNKSRKARKSLDENELNISGVVKPHEFDNTPTIKSKKSLSSSGKFEISQTEKEIKTPKKKKMNSKSDRTLLLENLTTTEETQNKLAKKLLKTKKTQIKSQNIDIEFNKSESNADNDNNIIFIDNQANVISNIKRKQRIKLPYLNSISTAEKSSTKIEKKYKRSTLITTNDKTTNYLREIKENSVDNFIERRNTNLTKAKLLTVTKSYTKDKNKTQSLSETKFSVKKEQAKPSKSEYDLVNEYVALNRNIYKNLIKPSGHGTTSGNIKVEGLHTDSIKIKKQKKKQKYKRSSNADIPAASLTGQANCFKFKEELLFGNNVKRIPISDIMQKRHVK